jgi:DNA polymerase II small subunit
MMASSFKSEREVYEFFSSKNILVSPDLVDFITERGIDREQCEALLENNDLSDCAVINKDMFDSVLSKPFIQVNWKDFEKALVSKEFDENPVLYSGFLRYINSIAGSEEGSERSEASSPSVDNSSNMKTASSGSVASSSSSSSSLSSSPSSSPAPSSQHYSSSFNSIDSEASDSDQNQLSLSKKIEKKASSQTNSDVSDKTADVMDDSREADLDEKGSEVASETLPKSFEYEPEEELLKKNPDYNNFEVIFNYEELDKKREVGDFVSLLRKRYNFLKSLLMSRNHLSSSISIKRLFSPSSRHGNDSARIIGMIYDIRKTGKGNYMIEVEDPTGSIKVFVSSDNPALVEVCQKLVPDAVIGIEGSFSKKMLFANQIFLPGVPISSRLKRSPDDAYALFISDIHVGSNQFLKEDFEKFLDWIRGERGSKEQKRLASLVKYIFVVGDLVDGVGIYPGQDAELDVKDIHKQYDIVAEYLSRIPHEKRIFVIPGNHDAVRLAEPQPIFPKRYAKRLYQMPNVEILTNPSMVRIHKKDGFPGFDVLMYHGYSFDHYVANVDAIRQGGGYDRADLIMRFLLDMRHLAPTHTSTLFVPDNRDDFLLIKKVPDFFVTGHIHKSSVSNYNSTTLICGSCWQDRTSFQEKVGHHPEPSKVPIVNLRTRDVKLLCFGKD